MHIHRSFFILLPLAFLVILCRPPAPSQTASPPGTGDTVLVQLIREYYAKMSDRDWPAYRAFFAEDATLTTVWQTASDSAPAITSSTIADFLAQTAEGPDSQPVFEEKPLSIQVDRKGNLANAWVKYEARFGTPDSLMEWKGYDLFSFIRHHEKWKIVSLVYEEVED